MRSSTASRRYLYTGGILLSIVLAFFILGLFWTPYGINETDAASKFLAPCAEHIFGTDNLGRDVFSRCLVAARYTLLVSFTGVAYALVIGTLAGLIAGYNGGIIDKIIMIFSNGIMCFPGILLALVAVAVFGPSLFNVIWALGLVFAPTFARVYRTSTIELLGRDYILQAKLMGIHPLRIMFVHILPNLMSQVLPAVIIGLANMTLFESGMSYLGLGVQPPAASYGKMLSDAQSYMVSAPWLIIFPTLMRVCYILGLYFISEWVRTSVKGGSK
ncbi:MAG: ABC transporter permease [Clostridiales bacterium]|nr:ABC transporter permease [Clostridiales bacterium]